MTRAIRATTKTSRVVHRVTDAEAEGWDGVTEIAAWARCGVAVDRKHYGPVQKACARCYPAGASLMRWST